MKLAFYFPSSHLLILFFALFAFNLGMAQDPPANGGSGNQNSGSGTSTGSGVPNFGLGDNDTWNMQVPNNPPGGTVTTSMHMDKHFVFTDDPNSGNKDIRVILRFTDASGNSLKVVSPRLQSNLLVLDYDLTSLPTDVQYVNDGKTGELTFPVDISLETPANYLTDSSQRYLQVHYEVYGKDSRSTQYSLILGKSANDYLTFNLVLSGGSRSRQQFVPGQIAPQLKVSPNPFSSTLRVEASGPAAGQALPRIMDLSGRSQAYGILSQQVSENQAAFQLDLSQLSPGYYLLSLPGAFNHRPLRILKVE